MRQAGRYLPEFREIRKANPDFIKLCLNEKLSTEITLQPLIRFDLDAAIIFSDILMLPYGLSQKVEFKKGIGPVLGGLNLENISKLTERDFVEKLNPVYKLINSVKNSTITKNKSTIGFVGAPWTLLVYMVNQESPKLGLKKNFFENKSLIDKALLIIEKYIKSFNIPVICFPRNIKNYKNYCNIVNPSVICIDYNTDPKEISKDIEIPVQGGMDPKVLLTDKENLKKEAYKYLDIFNDHPYIFNLGHGILPETDPQMMDYLVKMVKDY
jgi:uroporphyrinogen decarboxylase